MICKIPKYRESKVVDFASAKSNILEGIDKCIKPFDLLKGPPEALRTRWKNKISNSIEEKIAKLHSTNICPSSLQNKSVKEALKDLHYR